MITFPVEEDPFDEAECTQGFVLDAKDEWVRARNTKNAPASIKASAAQAFFQWFIASDYVMDKDAEGNPIRRATPSGAKYLIAHRLEWLAPGVRISPMEVVAPKLAVEMAYEDFTVFEAIDRRERKQADDAIRKAKDSTAKLY